MINYTIYSLNEPKSDIVRYIGYTKNPTQQRLTEHIKEAKYYPNIKRYKLDWIRSLLKKELTPTIKTIEDNLSFQQALQKEIIYMQLFKSFGAKLTNLSIGGRGNKGYKMPEEAKKKISDHNKKLIKENRHPFQLLKSRRKKGEYTPSEETLEKQRRFQSNRKKEPHFGYKNSDESKLKMRMAKLNDPVSMERIKNLGHLRKGVQSSNNKPILSFNLKTGETKIHRTCLNAAIELNVGTSTIWRGLMKKAKNPNKCKYKFTYKKQ